MEKYDIYKDISKRTGGDIYIGVIGPVRTGKSTFISSFMDKIVLPNISNKLYKQIATDEMPQSADGRTIMTSQPKFVPANAVKVQFKNKVYANVRLVDCVGYLVDGAIGHEEDGKPRLVKTPWSDEEITFASAAEIGTRKVIEDYSTIGILVTTDGSICDIPRESYISAEERVVSELKELNKPFVIVLNCKDVNSNAAINLRNELEEKYNVPVIILDVANMSEDDISNLMESVLYEFPMQKFEVDIPKWMQALPANNEIIQKLSEGLKSASKNVFKMRDFGVVEKLFDDENLNTPELVGFNLADGTANYMVKPKDGLFYKVLSEECDDDIRDEFELISYVKELSEAKREYSKIRYALNSAKETGYGIVEPDQDAMLLDEPIITRQNGRYGVKFKAVAPSLHIINVDLKTEVAPIVGNKEQSEELIQKLNEEFTENPKNILSTNIFGKTLNELINDGLKRKASNISIDAQNKMRKTVTRIVNDGKGGVICILL